MPLTREYEFSAVRALLGYPKPQKPSPDAIFRALVRGEQWQMDELGQSGRPWAVKSLSVVSVAGTREYTLSAADFGRPLYAYRDLGDTVMPVPFADYQHETADQRLEFFVVPGEVAATSTGEKLAVFRTADGERKVRIYPTPVEARTYTIVYASGWQDWSGFGHSDVPVMPEHSDMRCHRAALALLPQAEWDGLTVAENSMKRREFREVLEPFYGELAAAFRRFVRNPQNETVSTTGYWYE